MMSIQSGDIGAVKGRGITGWLSYKLFSPETDRFHFFIIWQKTGDDWVILESIGKGIAVGRLSFYEGRDIRFYRANCPYGLRRTVGAALTQYGRSSYDYLLIAKIVLGGVVAFLRILLKERKVRRLRAEDLCPIYTWDSKLICTEAAWAAYNMAGYTLVPFGVPPLPSSFKQAELEGRISIL